MKILLLSNNAPNYQYFFGALVKKLNIDGFSVSIAVDSKFSRDINKLDNLGFEVHEFSNFFSKHDIDNNLLTKYSSFNLNAALLSDYERSEVYGILGRGGNNFFDKLKSALLSFFELIYKSNEIDVILYENVSNSFSHFALFVAQYNNIMYCGIGGSRLPGRFSITSDPLFDNASKILFDSIRSKKINITNEVEVWCKNYINNIETIVPDYMKINGLDNTKLLSRYLKIDTFLTINTVFRHIKDDALHSFQIGNPLLHYFNLLKRNIKRKFTIKLLKNYYDDNKIKKDKFLLYPLHFHPESSTSILAGTYLNEYEVIKNIAFNLPEGVKLYVKDHVSAYGFPPINFYEKLKKLPNVFVISPWVSTKLLIKNSIGVITLSSTVGYEALLLGKKVFLFGRVFYEFHKDVIKITDPSNIFNLIKDNIMTKLIVDGYYNIDFVAAYFLSTKSGSLNLLLRGRDAEAMVESVYNEILSHIKVK